METREGAERDQDRGSRAMGERLVGKGKEGMTGSKGWGRSAPPPRAALAEAPARVLDSPCGLELPTGAPCPPQCRGPGG